MAAIALVKKQRIEDVVLDPNSLETAEEVSQQNITSILIAFQLQIKVVLDFF